MQLSPFTCSFQLIQLVLLLYLDVSNTKTKSTILISQDNSERNIENTTKKINFFRVQIKKFKICANSNYVKPKKKQQRERKRQKERKKNHCFYKLRKKTREREREKENNERTVKTLFNKISNRLANKHLKCLKIK